MVEIASKVRGKELRRFMRFKGAVSFFKKVFKNPIFEIVSHFENELVENAHLHLL